MIRLGSLSAWFRVALTSTLFAVTSAVPRAALACAPVPAEGDVVRIAEESAIISWDARSNTEHFIRRAAFQTQAKDFGFLVPTPTQPSLSAVDDSLFEMLTRATAPRVVQQHAWSGVDMTPLAFELMSKRAPPPPLLAAALVTVLDQKQVAGFDAVVLSATSPDAMASWLSQHGYPFRPTLREWLAPYIANGWMLTAFKVTAPSARAEANTNTDANANANANADADADNAKAARLGTQAVHMTFSTTQPFFPYREPSDQREPAHANANAPRMLRIFFLGSDKVRGTLRTPNLDWPGKNTWAAPLTDSEADLDLNAFSRDLHHDLPQGTWLNVFEDTASPRPGVAELYFEPAPDRASVKPPPLIVTTTEGLPIPADLVLLTGGIAMFALNRSGRKSRAKIDL